MPVEQWITDGDGTYIDARAVYLIEIEVDEDEDFDTTEERMNDGEGEYFFLVQGDAKKDEVEA